MNNIKIPAGKFAEDEELKRKREELKRKLLGEKGMLGSYLSSDNIVVVIPSFLNLIQQQIIREAKLCKRLLKAPAAVAIGYFFDKPDANLLVAVAILEHGSIDISVLEIGDGVFEVKSTVGEVYENKDLMMHITKLCSSALNDANVSYVDELILVGEPAYNPIVKHTIEGIFGTIATNIMNPDKLAEKGASIMSGVIIGGIKGVLLLDATPFSLGMKVEDKALTIIKANSTIPTRQSKIVTTTEDNQSSIEIHVLQYEQHNTTNCITIGRYYLYDIAPAPKGIPQIEVTFDIDANEVFRLSVIDKNTSNKIKYIELINTKVREYEAK